jgi:hypothetical protein
MLINIIKELLRIILIISIYIEQSSQRKKKALYSKSIKQISVLDLEII